MYMNYITSTELRTKTSELIETLKKGESVELIHRSKIVGVFKPVKKIVSSKIKAPKPFDPEAFDELVKNLNLPKTTHAQREKTYRTHLMKRHGKGISRR